MKKDYNHLRILFTFAWIVSIILMILNIIKNNPVWACVFFSSAIHNVNCLKIYELEEKIYQIENKIK